jgi:hypothetical protein
MTGRSPSSKSSSDDGKLSRLEARIARIERLLNLDSEGCPSLVDLERDHSGPTLRLAQAAYVVGLTLPKMRELVDFGDLRGSRIGRNYFVTWSALRHYLFETGVLPLPLRERQRAAE